MDVQEGKMSENSWDFSLTAEENMKKIIENPGIRDHKGRSIFDPDFGSDKEVETK